MRRPRVRFTLQRTMVVIVLVALVLAAVHSMRLIGRDAEERAADSEWANHPNGGLL